MRTVCSPSMTCARSVSTQYILSIRYISDMRIANTSSVVAKMVAHKTFWAVWGKKMMGARIFTVYKKSPVSLVVCVRYPNPARAKFWTARRGRSISIDFSPEPLISFWRHSVTSKILDHISFVSPFGPNFFSAPSNSKPRFMNRRDESPHTHVA